MSLVSPNNWCQIGGPVLKKTPVVLTCNRSPRVDVLERADTWIISTSKDCVPRSYPILQGEELKNCERFSREFQSRDPWSGRKTTACLAMFDPGFTYSTYVFTCFSPVFYWFAVFFFPHRGALGRFKESARRSLMSFGRVLSFFLISTFCNLQIQ